MIALTDPAYPVNVDGGGTIEEDGRARINGGGGGGGVTAIGDGGVQVNGQTADDGDGDDEPTVSGGDPLSDPIPTPPDPTGGGTIGDPAPTDPVEPVLKPGGGSEPDTASTDTGTDDGDGFSFDRLVGAIRSGDVELALAELQRVPPAFWVIVLAILAGSAVVWQGGTRAWD